MQLFMPFLFLVGTFLSPAVDAFPSGAGSCQGGRAATSDIGSHTRPTTVSGTLAEAEYTLLINGEALSTETIMDIPVGEEVAVSLAATDFFKGFLFRLSSETFLEVFTDIGDDSIQAAAACQDQDNTEGLTHQDSSEKTQVTGYFTVEEPGDVLLEVTVVKQNSGDTSEYFYAAYSLKAGTPETPPVEIPDDFELADDIELPDIEMPEVEETEAPTMNQTMGETMASTEDSATVAPTELTETEMIGKKNDYEMDNKTASPSDSGSESGSAWWTAATTTESPTGGMMLRH